MCHSLHGEPNGMIHGGDRTGRRPGVSGGVFSYVLTHLGMMSSACECRVGFAVRCCGKELLVRQLGTSGLLTVRQPRSTQKIEGWLSQRWCSLCCRQTPCLRQQSRLKIHL